MFVQGEPFIRRHNIAVPPIDNNQLMQAHSLLPINLCYVVNCLMNLKSQKSVSRKTVGALTLSKNSSKTLLLPPIQICVLSFTVMYRHLTDVCSFFCLHLLFLPMRLPNLTYLYVAVQLIWPANVCKLAVFIGDSNNCSTQIWFVGRVYEVYDTKFLIKSINLLNWLKSIKKTAMAVVIVRLL